ncbi:MAG: hypothetical protein ABW133_03740, partial [Polyangiaceae bacterium]
KRLLAIKSSVATTTIVQSDTLGTDVDEIGVGGLAIDIVSSTHLRIRVTGKAATLIDWMATIEGDLLWSSA